MRFRGVNSYKHNSYTRKLDAVEPLWAKRLEPVLPEKKFVYIMECCGFYKIGVARDVAVRQGNLQAANPFPIRLVASFESSAPLRDEKRLHAELIEYAVGREWFRGSPAFEDALVNAVSLVCSSTILLTTRQEPKCK
jgi:hypothetical protein